MDIVKPEIKQRVEKSLATVSDAYEINVVDEETARIAAEVLRHITRKEKELNALRLELVRPFNDAIKKLNAFFNDPINKLREAKKIVSTKIADWEKRRQAEEQARLNEIKQTQAQAVETGDVSAIMEIAAQSVAQEKIDGVRKRWVYSFEITDPDSVPRSLCSPDPKKIREYVNRLKDDAEIPGVAIKKELQIVSTGGRAI